MKTPTLLWVDGNTEPKPNLIRKFSPNANENYNVVWIRSYDEFVFYLNSYGLPNALSIADIGNTSENDGCAVCSHIIEYCNKWELRLPTWNIHTLDVDRKRLMRHVMQQFDVKSINTFVDTVVEISTCNRVEVIDRSGRAYVKKGDENTTVELSMQDQKHTLKIFIK